MIPDYDLPRTAGFGIKKDEPRFTKLVDDVLLDLEKSGEAEKIYAKWFLAPVPPKGLNLNFPMSDDMKALIKNPNDKALD